MQEFRSLGMHRSQIPLIFELLRLLKSSIFNLAMPVFTDKIYRQKSHAEENSHNCLDTVALFLAVT